MFNISSATQVVRDAVHRQTGLFIEDIDKSISTLKVEITSLNFPNVRAVHVGFTHQQGDIYNIIPT